MKDKTAKELFLWVCVPGIVVIIAAKVVETLI